MAKEVPRRSTRELLDIRLAQSVVGPSLYIELHLPKQTVETIHREPLLAQTDFTFAPLSKLGARFRFTCTLRVFRVSR